MLTVQRATHHRRFVQAVWRGDRLYCMSDSIGDDPTWQIDELDPISLNVVRSSSWPRAAPSVAGALAVHVTGDVIVLAHGWLRRLSPDLEERAATQVPEGTNGLTIMSDGMLIVQHPDGTGGRLMVVEPEELSEVSGTALPEQPSGKITRDVDGSVDLVYVPGSGRWFRYAYRRGALSRDKNWNHRYRRPIEVTTSPGAACVAHGGLWFFGNAANDEFDDDLVRVSPDEVGTERLQRVDVRDAKERWLLEAIGFSGGFAAAAPTVVAHPAIAIGFDSANGGITAWTVVPGDPTEILWQVGLRNVIQPLVLLDTRELVVVDVVPLVESAVVVLDLMTGLEYGRVGLHAGEQVSGVIPGRNRDIYVLGEPSLIRISAS